MPSVRRSGIDSFPHAPTSRKEINDLRILIRFTESSQERGAGCINGEVSKGLRFLAKLARGFRAYLSFTLMNSPPDGFLRNGVSIKLKGGADTKRQPSGSLECSLLHQ